MRKYLIIVLIVIFIVLVGTTVVKGFEIGDTKIMSVSNVMQESDTLDERIERVNQRNIKEYQDLENNLLDKNKELKKQKENYADLILFNTTDGESLNTLYENYEIEYLWTKLGNYATKNKLTMKLEVTNSTSGIKDAYNLNFTLNGEYVSIIDCIKGIEDDSTLGFKIENFNLVQGGSSELQATFTVKDVNIKGIGNATSSTTTQTTNTTMQNNTINEISSNTTSNVENNTTNVNNTVSNTVN